MDRRCYTARLADSSDDRRRAGHGITCSKDRLVMRLQRVGDDLDPATRVDEPGDLRKGSGIWALPDRRDDVVGRYLEGAVGNDNGTSAAAVIRLAEPRPLAPEAGDTSAADHHARRRGEGPQNDTFLEGVLDLLLAGGHLGARPSIQDAHLVASAPQGGSRSIHRGRAAANHQGPPAHPRGLARGQELERVDDSVGIVIGNSEL